MNKNKNIVLMLVLLSVCLQINATDTDPKDVETLQKETKFQEETAAQDETDTKNTTITVSDNYKKYLLLVGILIAGTLTVCYRNELSAIISRLFGQDSSSEKEIKEAQKTVEEVRKDIIEVQENLKKIDEDIQKMYKDEIASINGTLAGVILGSAIIGLLFIP